ncbi:aldose 1-epimerase family protein [Saccharibacillus sp. CPCC 101409]|uniref:aldose 1-epimerase family protein n=1 Tax=Saccharibacillus sp. CPCC 101409 TaxID=3058041 RepID=UPI002673979C|nr:aldose 1-epimerase family protein [Saccharibacillus sp. CPCC 101409]MDO3411585.1 aldose 1-epimerase family protein [Saccharibacillus sp. CPCC 101409]
MNQVLNSEVASVEIKPLGAEMVSFKRKDTGIEYVWSGDAKFWTGRSPVLFPIVGSVYEGKIRAEGGTYELKNHGFARTREFRLVEADEKRAAFRLAYDDETLAMYPYKFALTLTYTLDESILRIDYRVDNEDDKPIYFQLGTHPAFNCPIGGGEDDEQFEDYRLEFEQPETLERFFVTGGNIQIPDKSETLLEEETLLPLARRQFEEGAMIFRDVKSERVTLASGKNDHSVTVSYENFPYLGVWQPLNAPFVCIEPWHGLADADRFQGELKDKELAAEVQPGEYFEASLMIEVK